MAKERLQGKCRAALLSEQRIAMLHPDYNKPINKSHLSKDKH